MRRVEDLPEPWAVGGPRRGARDRAAREAGGVLHGTYALWRGNLHRRADQLHRAEGVAIHVDPRHPGAAKDPWQDRWTAVVDRSEVVGEVRFQTQARHRDGAPLLLTQVTAEGVRARWNPGSGEERVASAIPDGFVWERNDDYYAGPLPWDAIHDVRFAVTRVLVEG